MSDWYLIMTKPHKDSYAEEQLNNQGYTVYRPLLRCKKKFRDRIQIKESSLFPRYLFIQIEEGVHNWVSIRSTRGVLDIVRFGIEFAKVSNSLIQTLKNNEDKHKKLAEGLDRFNLGDKIIIDNGLFKGFEGIFEKYNGDERVIVLLNALQQAKKLELSLRDVEKIK